MRFPGLIHPGILGCAPTAEILAEWNRREGELIAANASADRDVAKPPEPKGAHAGAAQESLIEKIAREGARTIPVHLDPSPLYLYLGETDRPGPSRKWRQRRHQKPLPRLQNLPPHPRPRRQILRRRSTLLPRRR